MTENLRATKVTTSENKEVVSYWLHGPAFRGATPSAPPPCTVEATFAEGSPHAPSAAVHGIFGKGHVIASGVHPEMERDGESADEARERELWFADLLDKVIPAV